MTAAIDGSLLYLVPNRDEAEASQERRVMRNAPFNEQGQLYLFGDAIGLGQPGVFLDRARGTISFTVGNAKVGTTLRIGAMSSKRRRVVKALEVPVTAGWTFGNTPRDTRVTVTMSAMDCKRMGLTRGAKLAVQAVDRGSRGDITWVPLWNEQDIRPLNS